MRADPSSEPERPLSPGKWPRRRTIASLGVAFVVGAVVAIAALPLGRVAGGVGPGRVSLVVRWEPGGGTALVVPPLGRVAVGTHRAPLRLQARIESIDLDAVQRLAEHDVTSEAIERRLRVDLGPLVRRLLLRTAIVVLVAGAVTGAVLGRRHWRYVVAGVMGALVVVGALGVWTWRAYDVDAFAEPKYSGALERAPDVLAAIKRDFGDLQGVRDRVRTLSAQVNGLFAVSASSAATPPDNQVRILHISDIHSNPLGLEIARDLAERFEVAAVLDTGDLTSFGFPVESRIGRLVEQFPVPYYFVPGNHDSPANRRALAQASNLTEIDGRVVDVDGVRILGASDPGFTADNETSNEEMRRRRDAKAPAVGRQVARQQPDVLAVANLRLAAEAVGDVPLVLSGDVHRRTSKEEDGTLVLTVGSTGATGLGSFTVDTGRPYEAEVLTFDDGRLASLDYISMEGLGGNFTVDRHVYQAPEAPAD